MRKCKDCNLILDGTARFCPKCGKEITDAECIQNMPRLEVGAYLTSANLHRIRKEWDEAVADATEALQIEPNNADIASLLGIIYQERGMLDDAVTWLQMALEMNPNSTSDRAKLKQVKDQISQRSMMSRQHDHLQTFEKRTRIWAITMAAAFVIVVVFALLLTTGKHKEDNMSTAGQGRRIEQPDYSDREPSAAPIGSSRAPSGRSITSRQAVRESDPSNGSARTAAEGKINADTSQADGIGGAKVDDVIADPRQGVVTITCSVPPTSVNKNAIFASVSAVAKAAFASNSEVKSVTLRCVVIPEGASSAQIAFLGDISRQSFEALGLNPKTDQIAASFSNIWWNPQIN